MNSFDAQARGAVLDLTGDDDAALRAKKNLMKWDAKKKKYVKGIILIHVFVKVKF